MLLQRCFALDTRRRGLRSYSACRVRMEGGRCNRQPPADRLDPVLTQEVINERDQDMNRRTSSARAKITLALRRISLAWDRSRFSRVSTFATSPLVSSARALRWNDPHRLLGLAHTGRSSCAKSAPNAPIWRQSTRSRPLRGMFDKMLHYHPGCQRADLGRILGCMRLAYGSAFSTKRASDKFGAVECALIGKGQASSKPPRPVSCDAALTRAIRPFRHGWRCCRKPTEGGSHAWVGLA